MMHGIYKKPNNAVEKSRGLHLAVQPVRWLLASSRRSRPPGERIGVALSRLRAIDFTGDFLQLPGFRVGVGSLGELYRVLVERLPPPPQCWVRRGGSLSEKSPLLLRIST